jgi:integrase
MPVVLKADPVVQYLFQDATSRIYYAVFRHGSQIIKRSLKTIDKSTARQGLKKLRAQYGGNKGIVSPKKIKFVRMAVLWLHSLKHDVGEDSYRSYRDVAVTLIGIIGNKEIRKICQNDLTRLRAKRKDVSARTRNLEMQILRRILRFADIRYSLITDKRIEFKHESHKPRPHRIPTKEQRDAVLAEMRRESKAWQTTNYIEFLSLIGTRKTEGLEVVWKDMNFEENTAHLITLKQRTNETIRRKVPLYPALVEFLQRHKGDCKTHGISTKPNDKLFTITTAKRALAGAVKRIRQKNPNFPPFSHHDFRHFFATHAHSCGVDIETVALWLGHSDGGNLARKTYVHPTEEHSQKMAQLLK